MFHFIALDFPFIIVVIALVLIGWGFAEPLYEESAVPYDWEIDGL